jgi:tetratricopeptide (TPR) repeat protein/WD40 repeat protein
VYDLATARGAPELTRRYDGYAAPGVTFSSDAHTMYVAGFEDAVFVHDVASRKLVVPPLRHTTFTFFGGVTPEGTRLVTGGLDGTIALHDAASGSRVFTYTGCRQRPSAPGEGADLTQRNEPYSGQLRRVWVDAAGHYIFGCMDSNPSGYPTKSLLVALDATTGRSHAGPLRLASNILAETVTPDGRYWILGLSHLYYPDAETCIEIRSLPDLQLVRRLPLTQKPRALATSRDGTRILMGAGSFNEGGLAQVFSLETLGPLTPEIRFRGVVERVQFLHGDRHFLTASWDGAVRVWDAQTAQPAAPEIRVGRRITALAVHPEEHWIATGTGTNNIRGEEEQEVRYWDLRTGEPISPSFLQGNRVMDLTFAPDGARLASTSRDFHLRIWTLPEETRSFEELQALVHVTTGATLDAADNIAHLPGDTFREVWRGLVEQSRDDLAATPGEEGAWHRAHLERAASRNDLASAVEHVAKLIELDPTDADLYRRRLILNAGLDRWDQVPVDAQLFVQLRSLRGGELGQWAELIASLGPTPATLRSYALGLAAQGIEQAPDDPDAYAARAHLRVREGRWDEAADDLTRATELDPGNFRHWYELALVQRRAGQMEAAAVTCRRMRQAVPRATASLTENFVAWTAILGDPRAGDWEEVVARAQWAVERGPFDIQRIVSVGAAHYRAGNLDKAWQDLDRAHGLLKEPSSRQSSSPAYLWYFLAMTSHALGQADDARTWFEKAVQWGESLAAESEASRRSAVAWNREVTLALLRAEAENLLATDPNEIREPRLWQARARWYVARGNAAAAETALDRAVELAGDDPMPSIHRGRWSAERGEHEKADADFAHAVSLMGPVSSEGSGQGEGFELNKFLEAGWWVVGPYPAELKEFCPPEVDPDPSRPVHVIDPQTGLSDQPVNWQSVPTTQWGRVDLTNFPGRQDNASVYALSHVYSPDERTVLLMIHKSRPLRIWVNGEFLEDYVPGEYPTQPHYEHFHRVPIVLHSGRNTILIKAQSPDFYVRIGDTPRDRAILLAEQQRFAAAAQAFGQLPQAEQSDLSGVLPSILVNVLALEDNGEQYQRLCASLITWAEPQAASTKHAVAYFCAQTPNPVFDAHADQLVSYAEEYAASNHEQWALLYTALVNYRAGRCERVLSLLNEAKWKIHDLPLRAMLAHQSGDRELAQKTLDEALAAGEVDESYLKEHNRSEFYGKQHFCWWYDWATFLTLLTEAEKTIRGETTQSVSLKLRCEAVTAQKWAESPETVAFDQAMLFASRDDAGQLKYGQPYLARGKRLAALSRFDEAEADFSQAVELAPKDREVLVARARFQARRGRSEQVASDLNAAFAISREQQLGTYPWCNAIDLEFLPDPEVAERLAALQPERPSRVSTHLFLRGQSGDTAQAKADLAQLRSLRRLDDAGVHALLLGDRAAYEEICREAVETNFEPGGRLWLLLLGEPTCVAPADVLALAQQVVTTAGGNARSRQFLGLAQYRAGQYQAAAETLTNATDRSDSWQHDVACWSVVAMAHHRLGNAEQARKWLARANWYLDLLQRNGLQIQAFGLRNVTIGEYATAILAHREAQALIEGTTDPTRPLPAAVSQ